MADEAKRMEPVKTLPEDALRKLALSGKSVPSVMPGPPEERKGPFGTGFGASNLLPSKPNESPRDGERNDHCL